MEITLDKVKPGIVSTTCKKLVFKILNQLEGCQLTVSDQDGNYVFGEPGELRADIYITDMNAYSRLLFGGSIGFAESYIDANWHSKDLTSLVQVFARNIGVLESLEKKFTWFSYPLHLLNHLQNKNSKVNSRKNISAHYDISNEMYEKMLDPYMQYSSALFDDQHQSLEHAQINKLTRICDLLELKPDDHLLEIGTGWGGLACFAAQHYGCKVTTTTISEEQYQFARNSVEKSDLQNRVELLKQDYRDLSGQYDKIVSVEMIEAVGHDFMPTYFKKLNTLLKPDGLLVLQAITIKDQQYDQYRKGVDFIQRYIFPGGCLPSVQSIANNLASHTDMTMQTLLDFGMDYAKTIEIWQERFVSSFASLKNQKLDESFKRLWLFYFAYCVGGFREKHISVVHIKAQKNLTL